MTKFSAKSAVGFASDLCRTFVGPLSVVFLAAPAVAQDYSAFEQALTDCANFMAHGSQEPIGFLGNAQAPKVEESGVRGDVLYPRGSTGGGFDFAMSYEYLVGNSLTPPSWTCSGAGKIAPTWPEYTTVGWFSADARIRAAGLVELNYPGGPKAYSDCGSDKPNLFITLNPGAGDRVVFAATSGDIAATYCTSFGTK